MVGWMGEMVRNNRIQSLDRVMVNGSKLEAARQSKHDLVMGRTASAIFLPCGYDVEHFRSVVDCVERGMGGISCRP